MQFTIHPLFNPFHLSINLKVSLPSFSLGLPAYCVLALSESSSNLSRYDGIRSVADSPCTPLALFVQVHTQPMNRTQYFILCCLFSLINHFAWLGSTFSISRYGNQVYADELDSLYGDSRAKGLGSEVHTFQSFSISNLAARFSVALYMHIPV